MSKARPRFFACREFRCRLSVQTCAQRHRAAHKADPEKVPQGTWSAGIGLKRSACAGCEVGKAHRKGVHPERWPDGSPVVRIERLVRGDGLEAEVLTKAMRAKNRKHEASVALARKASAG